MAKTQPKRMDWYKKFPRDISSSWDYQRMEAEQRGAYNDLLDGCWINFEKGCGIQLEPEWLANAWRDGEWIEEGLELVEPLLAHIVNLRDPERWKLHMPAVLRKFKVQNGLLVNSKLLSQVDETLEVTVNASIRGSGKTAKEPEPSWSKAGPDLQQSSKGTIREEKRREEESRVDAVRPLSSVELDEIMKGNDGGTSTRPKGTPGSYERGKYPGTSPKAIFSHVAKAWARIRGLAAVCRYPSKYPESWELLCDSHSADILVPAFELWAVKNGYNTEWPLPEFIKVAQEYMSQVIPMKETKPVLSQETINRTNAAANAIHESVWAVKEPAVAEPDASSFLETE